MSHNDQILEEEDDTNSRNRNDTVDGDCIVVTTKNQKCHIICS